ncbi:hypothetical protein ACLOJK_010001 [Asimina triloba]
MVAPALRRTEMRVGLGEMRGLLRMSEPISTVHRAAIFMSAVEGNPRSTELGGPPNIKTAGNVCPRPPTWQSIHRQKPSITPTSATFLLLTTVHQESLDTQAQQPTVGPGHVSADIVGMPPFAQD